MVNRDLFFKTVFYHPASKSKMLSKESYIKVR